MMKRFLDIRVLHFLSFTALVAIFTVAAVAYVENNVAYLQLFGFDPIQIGRCYYKSNFDVTCPTCGLTRSFISLEHLDFLKAFFYNRVGPFVYLFFLLIMTFNLTSIFKAKVARFFGKIVAVYGICISSLLLMSWLLDIFFNI